MRNNRSQRAKIAEDTLRILKQGYYTNHAGEVVSIASLLAHAKESSRLYRPEDFHQMAALRDEMDRQRCVQTTFEVKNETTLHAAQRLANDKSEDRILCLNFASARNPGGGFLKGSQAQEESLARASGLYPCIAQMTEYYETNRLQKSCFYTDYMIYSPDVPIFRDDADTLLEQPYVASILTAPAVNRGAVTRNELHRLSQVKEVMSQRIEKLLFVCANHHHTTLVLGAWGCGAFRNSPENIAALFAYHLLENKLFKQRFKKIVFAVLDHTKELSIIRPFKEVFSSDTL
jgi:uncharacterized protein (TIGR02452 family)